MNAQRELHQDVQSLSQDNDNEQYLESKNSNLPTVGTRVRRGPNWHWQEQDAHGPGTVIGHHLTGRLS